MALPLGQQSTTVAIASSRWPYTVAHMLTVPTQFLIQMVTDVDHTEYLLFFHQKVCGVGYKTLGLLLSFRPRRNFLHFLLVIPLRPSKIRRN